MRRPFYIKQLFSTLSLWLLYQFVSAYNIDSLMTSLGQIPFDDQHKKIEAELVRLRDSNPKDGIELGNYWINVLEGKKETQRVADVILIVANSYYRTGNYALCLQYDQTARNLYRQLGNERGEAIAIRDMGFTYRKMGQNQDAYNYIELSIKTFEKIGDHLELAASYNHMGNLIEDWKNDLVLAEALYRKSIIHAEKENNKQSISYSYEFIGVLKRKQGENDSAVIYLNKSLEIRKELDLKFPMVLSYAHLAEVMDKKGNLIEAKNYYNKALEISLAINYHDYTKFIYGNLSKIHQKRGNLDSAITYLELQKELQDSLFNLQKTKEFAEIKAKYEDELKEEKIRTLNNQIELDEQKNRNRIYLFTTIIAILGAIVLIGIIIAIVIYNKNQRMANKEKINQERLRNKMIIEAEEKERTRIAKDLHDSLGQMLAALKMNLNSLSSANGNGQFEKTTKILDDTITEMRSISHAMMPESLIKNGLAKALIDISNHVDTQHTKVNVQVENWKGWSRTGEYVLYRVVQELLNNTLKHAHAQKVTIELNQFDDEINLIYEDDGKGFNLDESKSDGIGLKNMINRITSINGHIEFDSKSGSGFTAIISIPLKQEKL